MDALGATWETEGYPCEMGAYVLLRSLARGGMGEVHLAKHGGLAGIQKYCVVKTLKRFAATDEEYVRRFVDEARVVVSLQHKNICPVFDVGRVQGRYYLAMELISGRDLRGLIAGAQTLGIELTPALSLFIIGEVLEALDYAHRARDPNTGQLLHLVHRDISPQNVMLSFEGEVKLIDFGLAASTLKQERTNPNVVMGKLAYMPPEQLDGKDVDGRADLFAAAVMLYELLAKDRFYAGMTDGEILVAASQRTFEPRKLTEIEPELQTILRDGLHADRTQRLPDCGEFKDRLVRYQVERRMTATPRDLRRLIEKVFPADPEKTRAMLAQYASQRAPTRDDDADSPVIARSATAAPPDPAALKGIEELQGMSDDMMTAEPERDVDLEAALFGDFDAPAAAPPMERPGQVTTPGREPTEPTRDVKLATPPAAPLSISPAMNPLATPAKSDPFANVPTSAGALREASEATVVIPRQRTGETKVAEPKSRTGVFLAAGLAVVVLAAGAFFATRDKPAAAGSSTTVASAAASAAEPPAAAAEPAPPEPAADVPAVTEAADAGTASADAGTAPRANAAAIVDDKTPEPAAAAESSAADGAATKAANRAAIRSAKQRRAKAARAKRAKAKAASSGVAWKPAASEETAPTTGKLPKLRAGVKPEGKIKFLELYCRPRVKCANKLTGDFRGLRVNDAHAFWSKVDACVMMCSPGSLR